MYKNFFYGLSGVALPVPKYKFPPEHRKSSRLTYYSTFFNSIEINSSFYKIPMNATVARWASSVGDNFRFTFKLFRELTHVKNLDYDAGHIRRFIHAISHVGQKKGCLLIQFPPGLKHEHASRLENLLGAIHKADPENSWKIAVEFRYKGWYNDDVFDLLESFNCSLVIQDIPASSTPLNKVPCEQVYVRFHGPTGNYRGSYAEAFLEEYAGYIRDWLADGKTVYVYFNNTAGDAFNNLMTLKKLLA